MRTAPRKRIIRLLFLGSEPLYDTPLRIVLLGFFTHSFFVVAVFPEASYRGGLLQFLSPALWILWYGGYIASLQTIISVKRYAFSALALFVLYICSLPAMVCLVAVGEVHMAWKLYIVASVFSLGLLGLRQMPGKK